MERAIVALWARWHDANDHKKYIPQNQEDLRSSIAHVNGVYDGEPWSYSLDRSLYV